MLLCEEGSTTGQLRAQLCKTKLVEAGVAIVTFGITIPGSFLAWTSQSFTVPASTSSLCRDS